MGAERQRRDRPDRNAEFFGDEMGEASGIEHSSLTQHSLVRKTGHDVGQRSHLIEWISNVNDDAIGRIPGDVLGDLPHDGGVRFNQVHAAHPGLAR